MGLRKKGEIQVGAAPTDTHKVWLIMGIGLAAVLILSLIFYSPAKKAVFGKAVEEGVVHILPFMLYDFNEARNLGQDVAAGRDATCSEPNCPEYVEDPGRVDAGAGVAQFFPSENDYFTFSPPLLTGDFTIMFWINTDGSGSILSGPGSDSPLIAIHPESRKLRFQYGSFLLESTRAVPTASWVHYMITRSGTTMSIYTNGVLDVILNLDSIRSLDFTTIGTGAAGFWEGRLDNFQIFNVILTAEQFSTWAGIPLAVENNGRVCADNSDNDLDGRIDCADADCDGLGLEEFTKIAGSVCQSGTEHTCNDLFDNDGDGARDCADADCDVSSQCQDAEVACSDLFDNDGDALIDCADSSCLRQSCGAGCQCTSREVRGAKGVTIIYAPSEIACADGTDNDGDRLVDCFDPNCQSVEVADSCVIAGIRYEETTAASGMFVSHEASCANGIDDDKEGGIDCADVDCSSDAACVAAEPEPPITSETQCSDGVDEDNDGVVDCADTDDCSMDAACVESCTPLGDVLDDGTLDGSDVFALTLVLLAVEDDSCGALGTASCEVDDGFYACDNGVISSTPIGSCI